ncbi:uncharacterized protein LOC127700740 isoform X2 [Mytilus californianus]|uniref:uncharacterized protein LOC127700740 isoform X2 n=1 Tax=Mytilus californianus TaxID=6549 RepID=UPI002247F4F3|nr:uncharacterized protein LOC127700740 isoform X2 [Mytilus californianus]
MQAICLLLIAWFCISVSGARQSGIQHNVLQHGDVVTKSLATDPQSLNQVDTGQNRAQFSHDQSSTHFGTDQNGPQFGFNQPDTLVGTDLSGQMPNRNGEQQFPEQFPDRNGGQQMPDRNGEPQFPTQNGEQQIPSQNGEQQFPNQNGEQQFPDQNGGQQFPNQNGEQQFPDSNGEQQFPNQNGGQQFPNQNGGQQFPNQNGEQLFPIQNGEQQFPNQNGEQQFPGQNGEQQFPIQNGEQQFPDQNGEQQFPDRNGEQQFPDRNGEQQFPNQNGKLDEIRNRNNARYEDSEWWGSDSSEGNFQSVLKARKFKTKNRFIKHQRPFYNREWSEESDSRDWDSDIYTKENTDKLGKHKYQIRKRVNYDTSSDDSFWDSFENRDRTYPDRKLIVVRKQHRKNRRLYSSDSESDRRDWDSNIYSKENTKTDNLRKHKNNIRKRVNYDTSSDDSFWDSFEDRDNTHGDRKVIMVRNPHRKNRRLYSSDSNQYDDFDEGYNYIIDNHDKQSKLHKRGKINDDIDGWDDSSSSFWEDTESDQRGFYKPKHKFNLKNSRNFYDGDSLYSDSWEDSSENNDKRKHYKSYKFERGVNYDWESDSWESDGWDYQSKLKTVPKTKNTV